MRANRLVAYETENLIIAINGGMGFWLAYVKVPPGHPWDQKDYDYVRGLKDDLPVELTFSGDLPLRTDWWLGWDYGHAYDLPAFPPIDGSTLVPMPGAKQTDMREVISDAVKMQAIIVEAE